ncbi:MAG: serine hydrolase, partial [Pseudomonadota bacterium]
MIISFNFFKTVSRALMLVGCLFIVQCANDSNKGPSTFEASQGLQALPVEAQVEAKLSEMREKMQIPNMTVSYFSSKEIQGTHSWGEYNGEKTNPNKHLFNVGSIAKTLTSTAVFQLVEKGLIDIEKL